MSCPNYKIIFNDETNYVAQDISEEPVVRVIPVKGEQGETGPKGEDGKNFEPTIVSELPTTGDESKLYLTPKAHTTQTATGNPITISLGEDAGQITSAQLDGDTYQQSYTGKNLWSATTLVNGYYKFADGSLATRNTNYVTSTEKIDVTAGESYHISADKGTGVAGSGCVFFNNDTFVSSSVNPSGSNFTVPEGANKMAFNFFNSAGLSPSEVTHIQLEAGSTATSYEPYVGGVPSPNPDYPQAIQTVTGTQTVSINGTDYPIDLGSIELCNLGDYQDYIYKSGSDWKVHKATAKQIINGNSNVSYQSQPNATSSVVKVPRASATYTLDLFCATHFSVGSQTEWNNRLVISTLGGDNVFYLRMENTITGATYGTASSVVPAFVAWLTANPVSVIYSLATATDTTITDTNLIAQLEAVRNATLQASNTITNTATGTNLAGDLELGYYEYDPQNRYDKWLWLDLNNNYEKIGS